MPLIRHALDALGALLCICLLAVSTLPLDGGPFEDEDQ